MIAIPPTKHARERARQRYGLELNDEIHGDIVWRINQGLRSRLMGSQDNCEVWYVHTPTGPANVIFDPEAKKIVTFLPKGIRSVKRVRVPFIPAVSQTSPT